jgi:hypothetical protein
MNKSHVNMKAKWQGKLGFDFIPKRKTSREYLPLTTYNLGFLGNPGISSQKTS